MTSATAQWARQWVELTAQAMSENREYLIDLDRQIGDGDHGENMDRGFSAVLKGNGLNEALSGADVLRYVARTLLSSVGGAAGPLYGTAYLRAATEIPEQDLTGVTITKILGAALEGIQARGKASPGEKTMVDAWQGAIRAAELAVITQAGPARVWAEAARGAKVGATSTIPMRATKGRASYLGERSIGHLDPGAQSTALIIQAAATAAQTVWGEERK